jgi:hypothetical protein
MWNDGTFENGLQTADRDLAVEFFVHARRPSGASLPVVEISYPFVWYWDARPTIKETRPRRCALTGHCLAVQGACQ